MTLARHSWPILAVLAAMVGGCATPSDPLAPQPKVSEAGIGPELWRWAAPPRASVGAPAVDADGVVATYGYSRVVALDLDGTLLFDVAVEAARDVAPLLTEDVAVVATEDALVAIDRADGSLAWSAPAPDRANTPVGLGGIVAATTWEGGIVAVDATTGTELWSVPLGLSIGPGATVPGHDLVLATWDDGPRGAGLLALDATSGAERWRAEIPPGGVSAPAVAGDSAIVVAGDAHVHAFELATGRTAWRRPTSGGAGSPEIPPVATNGGGVVVADRLGGVLALDADGRELWSVAGEGAAIRGGLVGPMGDGRFALALDDGRTILAGPESDETVALDGRVAGLAQGPGGPLVAAQRDSVVNHLVAFEHS